MGRRHRTDETHVSWRRAAPIGRTGQVEDIVGVVGFLVSEEARFITGQVLPIDGGTSATAVMLPLAPSDSVPTDRSVPATATGRSDGAVGNRFGA